MKVSQLKKNPSNPREIKDEKFDKLKKSIQDFPQMMALRPIVIDADNVILGGNMRLAAIKSLGMKDIPAEWVVRADDLTDEQKREFIIKDNNSFGQYDWEALANGWDDLPLTEWGVDMPEVEVAPTAPEKFAEYDESIDTEHECPKCGYTWSGKRRKRDVMDTAKRHRTASNRTC